ncbi:phosphoribosyl-dephospho-CoA transferase [Kitasatospora gansuensis]|uniref:Phosphoribosyl-dephospho-CoA transferase n=1 Tax=Kitasatospora gansuensis TaxID=258050 RepID=A0A7W7SGZ2_9ACTN|nr:phosphoribosyl-dephospho-CoA transferase MdcG domain-containing protein [Kitasatospora gansuensis]MBB4949166.1 phosphoribosyl-dephospho-CoA transferase [Kitasatospora gansuensis]
MTTAAPRRRSRSHEQDEHPGRPRRMVGPVPAMDGRTPTAHDLLLLHCPSSLRQTVSGGEPLQNWARAVLRGNPWVTVRRAPVLAGFAPDRIRCTRDPSAAPESWLPVSLRGPRLDQRAEGYAPRSAVAVTLKPEQLPVRLAQLDTSRLAVPALAALPEAAAAVESYNLTWGPIGAVGCELATGVPVTAPDSPLRLLLRSPLPFSRRDALLLRRRLRKLPVRFEAELETRHGAVSLAEYSTSPQSLTLHTPDGPRIVGDPWFPRTA